LLAGRYLGLTWLDPLMGIVGGVVILKWGVSLCKHAAFDLLDVDLSSSLEDAIRSTLERIDDVRIRDLHVWSLGRGDRACIISLVSSRPRESTFYKQCLGRFGLAHLTVEVARGTDEHALANASAARVV
jgi:Co/Zn/Cd efflux system component